MDILRVLSYPHPNNAECSEQPMRDQYNRLYCNLSFLIDLIIVPLDDVSADDNGCYLMNGNSRHTYKWVTSSGLWKIKSSFLEPTLKSNEFHFRRIYRRLKKYPDFRQTISYLRDERGDIVSNTAIIQ